MSDLKYFKPYLSDPFQIAHGGTGTDTTPDFGKVLTATSATTADWLDLVIPVAPNVPRTINNQSGTSYVFGLGDANTAGGDPLTIFSNGSPVTAILSPVQITPTITVASGTYPYIVVYDPSQDVVWVSCYSVNRLQSYDATTGDPIFNIPTTTEPFWIAVGNDGSVDAVWVSCIGTFKIQKYNATTGVQMGSDISVGTQPTYIAFDASQSALWVIDEYNPTPTLYKIDLTDAGTIINSSVIDTFSTGLTVGYDGAINAIWVCSASGNNVRKFDASTNAEILTDWPVTTGTGPQSITFDVTNNVVWVGNYDDLTIQGFDAVTGTPQGPYPTVSNPQAIMFDVDLDVIWVTCNNNVLQRFDAVTGAQVGGNAITGSNPQSIAPVPGQSAVWITNSSSDTIERFDLLPFDIGAQIDVAQGGAGTVTFVGDGVTINSQGGNLSIAAQYVGVTLIQVDTDVWYLFGNLIA